MELKRHFISYPKSGRTWVRYALTLLGVADKIHFHHDGFEFNNGDKPPHNFDCQERIHRYQNVDRVIYMSREPKDLITSLYFQVIGRFCDFFGYKEPISEFIRDDYFGIENLRKYRAMWERMCAEGYAMHITYEECHKDFIAVLEKVMRFYDFHFTMKDLGDAVEGSTFDRMKRVEASNTFPHPWMRPRNDSPKIRRGKVGGHADELTAEDIAYIDAVMGRN